MPLDYAVERPKGRIKTLAELQDIIIEARKEKKAIRLWGVQQLGHLEEIFLTSKSKIIKPEKPGEFGHYNTVPCWMRSPSPRERWYKYHFLPASYGIHDSKYDTEFALFTNKRLAMEYSERLKSDPKYIASVRRWHDRCAIIFKDLDLDL